MAAEGAVWYARRIAGGPFAALHVPGKSTDTGIHARWFDLTGGEPRLDVLPAGTRRDHGRARGDRAAARGRRDRHRRPARAVQQASLMAAAQRAQFRLKLRLLVEPDVVVADVPTVTSERRPEGRVPEHLAVRVRRRPARRRDEAGGRLRAEPRRRRPARRPLRRARLGRVGARHPGRRRARRTASSATRCSPTPAG